MVSSLLIPLNSLVLSNNFCSSPTLFIRQEELSLSKPLTLYSGSEHLSGWAICRCSLLMPENIGRAWVWLIFSVRQFWHQIILTQYLEKAPTRNFSLLKVHTSTSALPQGPSPTKVKFRGFVNSSKAHPPLPKSMLNTGEMQKKDRRNGININLIVRSIIILSTRVRRVWNMRLVTSDVK